MSRERNAKKWKCIKDIKISFSLKIKKKLKTIKKGNENKKLNKKNKKTEYFQK